MMRYLSDKIRFLHQNKKNWEMKMMLDDKKEEKGYRKIIGWGFQMWHAVSKDGGT